MTRYVSLSCDANPHYAIYAPIVIRIWKALGYEPLIFLHNDGWQNTRFASRVLLEIMTGPGHVCEIPRIEPLSVANTMRVARLAAASLPYVDPEALVLTSDIDMAPLSRTFFERDAWDVFVLRADLHGPIEGCASFPGAENKLHDGRPALLCGHFRFPMCYVGMRARIWRDVMPLIVGDAEHSIRRINHGLRHDSHEHDEATTSARLLHSRYAVEPLERLSERHWQQGNLQIVTMTDWPFGTHRNMLIGGQANAAVDPNAVDWHMPKPAAPWCGRVLARYYPELAPFIEPYWAEICQMTQVRD